MDICGNFLIGLVVLRFLPVIHLLSIFLNMYISKLFNKLLDMFFCLMFFSPVALLFIIFCVGFLLF
jgi:hypothetical protein